MAPDEPTIHYDRGPERATVIVLTELGGEI